MGNLGKHISIDVSIIDNPADLAAAFEVRRSVFVVEQEISEREEYDGLDDACIQFLARVDGRPTGTARLRITPEGQAKAQRVAVLASHRGLGVGAAIMRALDAEAARRGFVQVSLAAQLSAIPFYESVGYEAYGEIFWESNIEHRWMVHRLQHS